jgi:hypothetical protein
MILLCSSFPGLHRKTTRQFFHSRFPAVGDRQIHGKLSELIESAFEVIDDLPGENVGIWELAGFFEAFVSEPEYVEADLVVGEKSAYLHLSPHFFTKKKTRLTPLFFVLQTPTGEPDNLLCFLQIIRSCVAQNGIAIGIS